MHMAVIKAPPVAVGHFAVGIVVAASHAAKVVAHGIQVIDWRHILHQTSTSSEMQGLWRNHE